MRYFFTIREPQVSRILLVESGSRGLLEGIIPGIRKTYGNKIFVDLVTCYSGLPEGFHPENTAVYRVTDYRGPFIASWRETITRCSASSAAPSPS